MCHPLINTSPRMYFFRASNDAVIFMRRRCVEDEVYSYRHAMVLIVDNVNTAVQASSKVRATVRNRVKFDCL